MSRTLLLNVAEPEERRAALLEDGRLSLLWVERSDERTLVGNIYNGRVVRVEPAIGAAFVDIGLDRPGFLHADDVVPYARRHGASERSEPAVGDDDAHSADVVDDSEPEPEPPRSIDELLANGDEVVVQVARDAIGHKGASLTARLSFPGRLAVLLPGLGRPAVSRKIEDMATRDRLRTLLAAVCEPGGDGYVARTASARASDDELRAEALSLRDVHAKMRARAEREPAPALLHGETAFASRAVRELLVRAPEGATGPVRVVVDDDAAVAEATAALAGSPGAVEVIRHGNPTPLFHSFGIEDEVRHLASPRVALPGGASLAIHETEALWAIDVNSGRRRRGANLEATALETDLLAAEEIARQIRLRDVSGLVVVDFIDCRDTDARNAVEQTFRRALSRDPARMRVAPISDFMVVEITRRRMRAGAGRAGSLRCPCCHGSGRVRTPASAALAAIRDVRALAANGTAKRLEITCSVEVADALEMRSAALDAIERDLGVAIDVVDDAALGHDGFQVGTGR